MCSRFGRSEKAGTKGPGTKEPGTKGLEEDGTVEERDA
jgi:hypothetical protein